MAKHTDAIRKHLGGDPTDPIEQEISAHLVALDEEQSELLGALERMVDAAIYGTFATSSSYPIPISLALISRIKKSNNE